MLSILCALSSCNKPIVIIPPLYGSNLFITYQNVSGLHSYCTSKVSDKLLWVNPSYAIPPVYNCLFQLLTVYWDNETENYMSRPNTTISVHDFGGDSTVKYIAHGLGGWLRLIESFKSLIQHFKHKGYVVRRDIFAAPFDWRLAVAGLDLFWPNLKNLVEHAYRVNRGQKVTIFGYSCGGFTLQQFLAEHVDQEWKDKYLDRAIFLAPSFGGAGASLPSMYTKTFPIVPIIKNDDLDAMIESMPVVHQHFPNWEIFGDREVIRTPEDNTLYARDVPQFLIDQGKVKGDNIKIMMKAANISSKAPRSPGLPTYIIYNSAVPTDFNLKFKNGYNKDPIVEKTGGDGTVFAAGPEYACNHWTAPVKCLDLYKDSELFEHQPLAANPFVHDIIYHLHTTDKWMHSNTTRKIIRAPLVEITSNNSYTIRNDIRPKKIIMKKVVSEEI